MQIYQRRSNDSTDSETDVDSCSDSDDTVVYSDTHCVDDIVHQQVDSVSVDSALTVAVRCNETGSKGTCVPEENLLLKNVVEPVSNKVEYPQQVQNLAENLLPINRQATESALPANNAPNEKVLLINSAPNEKVYCL